MPTRPARWGGFWKHLDGVGHTARAPPYLKGNSMSKIAVIAKRNIIDPTTARLLVPKGTIFVVYGTIDCITGEHGGVLFPVELHEIRRPHFKKGDSDAPYFLPLLQHRQRSHRPQ